MQAFILAAGFGKRLMPLTMHTPKPLIKVGEYSLIEHHLEALATAGVTEVIINLHYLGDKIKEHLGSGKKYNLRIVYSEEEEILGTGGALVKALPRLQAKFILLSADIFTDYSYVGLTNQMINNSVKQTNHIVLVDNPRYNLSGDFSLNPLRLNKEGGDYTYASIAVLSKQLIKQRAYKQSAFALPEFFALAISQRLLSYEIFTGIWYNVGTQDELTSARHALAKVII